MTRGIMRLNRLGRRRVGNKVYQVYKTTPAYREDALEALRGDWKTAKPTPAQKGVVIILVRGSKY